MSNKKTRRQNQGWAKIIPAEKYRGRKSSTSCVIGGDNDNEEDDNPPVIIVEKGKRNEISKITVKCSCGKHAELDCTYSE